MPQTQPAHPARLLIADDEEGLLFLMVDVLRREGYQVEGFESGEEALAWLTHESADLLLLDLKLIDLPAPLLIDRLRERGRDFPFIIVTGHGDERTAVDVMKQGALDYVMKDAGMLDLLPGIVRRTLDVVEREGKLTAANEIIRQREERHQYLIQIALDGFVRFQRDGRILEVNKALCDLLGCRTADLLDRDVFADDLALFRQDVREHVAQLESDGAVRCFTPIERRDGTIIEAELSLREARGEVFGFVHDISEQRRLERVLLQNTIDERQHFGRELHDGIGQQLTALELMMHTLARELDRVAPQQATSAHRITKYIRGAISETRKLAHGLSPIAADDEGLMVALHDLAEMTAAAGSACEFACPQPVKLDDRAIAGHLYRIAQEAVTNALRHGAPKHIWLRLEGAGSQIQLIVEDDGSGLPKKRAKTAGMGLQVMQHRSRLMGGKLTVHSLSGKGVRIVCSVPNPQ